MISLVLMMLPASYLKFIIFTLNLEDSFSFPRTLILKPHFQRGCLFEGGVDFREALMKNKDNIDM